MKYLFMLFLFLPAYIYAIPSNITVDQILELSNSKHKDESFYFYCSASGFQATETDLNYWDYDLPDFIPSYIEFQYKVYFERGQHDGLNGIEDAEIRIEHYTNAENEGIYFRVGGFDVIRNTSGFINLGGSKRKGGAGRIPQEEGVLEFIQFGSFTFGDHNNSIPMGSMVITNEIPNGEKGLIMIYEDLSGTENLASLYAPVSCRITKISDDTDTIIPSDDSTTPNNQTSNPTETTTDSGGGSMPLSIFLLFIFVGVRRCINKRVFSNK